MTSLHFPNGISHFMRIAVNTRFLLKGRLEGFGVFTHEVMRRITQQHSEHEFLFLFDRSYDPDFIYGDNVTPLIIPPQARHPILWYLWFEWSLPRIFRKYQPDLFLSPDGYLSLSTNIPSVPVIHDLAFEHYPQDVPQLTSWYYRHYFPRFAKHASCIATVSKYSKKDIVDQYGISRDEIDVIYNGAGAQFQPLSDEKVQEYRNALTEGRPYFVYVGSLHQRKNITNLLKAYDRFRGESEAPWKLVIIGRKAWGTAAMEETYEGMIYRDDVILTGSLNQADLVGYLASAGALTYVSYFEGFGLPLLEAMYCDVPVITANATSLIEVAGDAALLSDPFDPDAIASNMRVVAEKPRLREELVEQGRRQRHHFSWDQTANRLWKTMMRAISS